jgi:multidrug transporter EmrE-like cation transporter
LYSRHGDLRALLTPWETLWNGKNLGSHIGWTTLSSRTGVEWRSLPGGIEQAFGGPDLAEVHSDGLDKESVKMAVERGCDKRSGELRMIDPVVLILIAVVIGVVGQVSLKVGMNQVGAIDAGSLARPMETLMRVFSTPLVWLGLSCYGVSALLWLVVLSRLDLSYAYLMLASMYVLIPLVSWLFLGERIPPMRWLGMVVVVLGVVIVARS